MNLLDIDRGPAALPAASRGICRDQNVRGLGLRSSRSCEPSIPTGQAKKASRSVSRQPRGPCRWACVFV